MIFVAVIVLRILLADTESENIKNFRNFLKITYPDIKYVKALMDPNRNIFEIIREEEIHLVVADIRFFGFNAYQTIRNIYEIFSEVKLILYGTYNDADYLKRTLDFGVINYMYKPVKPTEFKKAMENAIDIFQTAAKRKKEEELLKTEYFEKIPVFEDKFLNNLLMGYVKNDQELYRSFEYFNFKFSDRFCTLVIRIDHFKKLILTLDEMEKHMLIFRILNIVNKAINSETCKATITNFNSIAVILSGALSLEDIVELSTRLKNHVYERMQIRVAIGIGRIYDRPSDLSVSYNEAEAALRYRFYLGYNSIIPFEIVEPDNHITYSYPLDKETKLVYAAVIGEYAYCELLLDEIIDVLKSCGELPDKLAPKIILNMLISISRYASEQNILVNSQFSNFFSFKDALEIRDIDEAKSFMATALRRFCEYVVSVRNEKDNELFTLAVEEVSERYYEHFSIPKLATKLGTTADYLNHLFLLRENKSFNEFVISKKIIVSKQLLKDTDLDEAMIAFKSGFDEPRVFRSLFKQYEGIFPYEYKARYGGK